MVRFNSNDGIGSFGLGRTLFALSPAPASRDHQSGFVRKNYFSWLWMLYFGLTQRCIPFCSVGKMYGDRSLQRTGIEDCDRQGIANADQVTKINQQVDTGNIAFLGQTTQQGLSGTAILSWIHIKAAQSITPRRQRFDLTERSITN